MDFEQFKAIADSIIPNPVDDTPNKQPDSNSLYEQIRKALGGPKHEIRHVLFELINEATIKREYYGEDVSIPLGLARTFFDATNTTTIASGEPDWPKAMQIVLDNPTTLTIFFRTSGASSNPLPKFKAKCALALKGAGYTIDFKAMDAIYTTQFTRDFNQEIDELCLALGGVNIVNCLMNTIADFYDIELGRYVLPRSQEPLPAVEVAVPAPVLPLTYLLLLGFKHARNMPAPLDFDKANEKWHRLIMLIVNSVGTLGLQPVGRFDGLILDPFSVWQYLGRMAKYEALCFPAQMNVSHFNRFAKGILDYYQSKYGVQPKLERLFEISSLILSAAPMKRLHIVEVAEIAKAGKYSEAEVREAITALEQPVMTSFNHLQFPPDSSEKGFGLFPLRQIGPNKYLLAGKEFATPAMLESFYSEGRKVDSDFDGRIGNAADKFLANEFKERNIQTVTGTYKMAGKQTISDCDVVLETNDTIYSFEIKKKVFVRQSIGGDPQSIFVDIAKGLIKAQIQSLTHELTLRRNGYLELVEETGNVYRLELKKREFKRISLTWSEVGFLYDKTISTKLTEIFELVGMKSDHPDTDIQSKFNSLGSDRSKLQGLVSALECEFGISRRKLLFSGRFLSLPIMLTVLDECNDTADFITLLNKAENIFTGQHDWYSDFRAFKEI